MRNWIVAAVAALGALLAPAAAEAANGYTTGNVNMRAGPGVQYPRILVLPAGAPVTIYGCLQGYSWCDVAAYHERGWVSSRYLDSFYDDRRVYVPYQPRVRLPIISFEFGYWDRWYSNRPWYRDRRWRDDGYRQPRIPDFNDGDFDIERRAPREGFDRRAPREEFDRRARRDGYERLPEEVRRAPRVEDLEVFDGGRGVRLFEGNGNGDRPRRCRPGDPACDSGDFDISR